MSLICFSAKALNDDLTASDTHDYGGVFRLGSVWSLTAIFDVDEQRVYPAVLDIGFEHGASRPPGRACEVRHRVAQSPQFACNSPLGSYSGFMNALAQDPSNSPYRWHGNRMKNRIAALIGNGGPAGIAGQVATPNLYQFPEVNGFLFDLDATIDRAVADGSTLVSISAGIPCQLQWQGAFTGNLCTPEGVLQYCLSPTHTPFSGNPVSSYLHLLTPRLKDILCLGAATNSAFQGSLRSQHETAGLRARQRGVPIIASAGNLWRPLELGQESLDLTPIEDADVSAWGIIPATVDQVIAVGALARSDGLPNADFHGDRVDIWAPSGDTSPAAAYVSGVVSLMQAFSPKLNPRSANLGGHDRLQIVARIRDILQSTAYSAAHPDIAPDPYRRNVINPYGAVREAARGHIPDFEALGYPQITEDLMLPDHELPSEHPHWRIALDANPTQRSGSIVTPLTASPQPDKDTYWLTHEGTGAATELRLRLTTLRGYGDLALEGVHRALEFIDVEYEGVEQHRYYRLAEFPGSLRGPLAVNVEGQTPVDDNLYKLNVWLHGEDPAGNFVPKPGSALPSERELVGFMERLESAFPGPRPPEVGCLRCNLMDPRGELTLSGRPHVFAGQRGLPRDAGALRLMPVTRAGTHEIRIDAPTAKQMRNLSITLIDDSGRTVARSKRGSLALSVPLKPGVYGVVIGGQPVKRTASTLSYQVRRLPDAPQPRRKTQGRFSKLRQLP